MQNKFKVIQSSGDLLLNKLENIVKQYESACQNSGTMLIQKTNEELPRQLSSILNDVFSHGFVIQNYKNYSELESIHPFDLCFYTVFSRELSIKSFEYLNSLTFTNTDKKRSILWPLIELHEKNITNIINIITEKEIILNCYEDLSMIKTNRIQLKQLIARIEKLNFQISGDIISRFKQFLDKEKDDQKIQQQQTKQIKEVQEPKVFKSKIASPINELKIYSEREELKELEKNPSKQSEQEEKIQFKPNSLFTMFNQMSFEGANYEKKQNDIVELPQHLKPRKRGGKKPSQELYEEVKITFSYIEKISQQIDQFAKQKFTQRPELNLQLKDQDFKCWACQSPINSGFISFGSNCDYCMYSGRYYCLECMSEQRMPIPWKAIQEFDLRHHKVSKLGFQEIEQFYEVPMLELEYESPIVKKSKTLFEFMVLWGNVQQQSQKVLKRQLHLVFDIICDPNIIFSLLEKRINLCLKQNILSLKNLYEISNGSLLKMVEGFYSIIVRHIDHCKSCQKRGQICKICKSMRVVHAFDIKNVTYCEKCCNLYHRICFEQSHCPHCLVNNG